GRPGGGGSGRRVVGALGLMRAGRSILYFPVNSDPVAADASETVARQARVVQLAACIFLLIPRRAAPRLSEVVAWRAGVLGQVEACIFLLISLRPACGRRTGSPAGISAALHKFIVNNNANTTEGPARRRGRKPIGLFN